MARNVQVVLRADVQNLGLSGALVRVRPGFARNYLIPRGMAVIASRENVKTIQHEKQLAAQRMERRREEALEMAKAFDGLQLHVAKQVADPMEGKLFGSVSIGDVMEALSVKGFDSVDKRNVVMPEDAIKVTGSYEIHIKLPAGVQVPVKLEVKTAS